MSSRGGNFQPDATAPDQLDLSRPHLVGIAGAGMSALAELLHQACSVVSGSDANPGVAFARVQEFGRVHLGHDPRFVPADATCVVVTSAIGPDNPEVAEAHRRGLPVVHRAVAMAHLMAWRCTIAVAGCHGKSSTTTMLTTILRGAGMYPSHMIGAVPAAGFGPAHFNPTSRLFVCEADESDRSFLALRPSMALITNLDNDHTEEYPTLEDLLDAAEQFAASITDGGTLIINLDDPGTRQLATRLAVSAPQLRIVTYGRADTAMWRIDSVTAHPTSSTLVLDSPHGRITMELDVPGAHMAHNAVGALAAAAHLGVDTREAVAALAGYTGVRRRLERSEAGGVVILDSHAHHPTAIAADLAAARLMTCEGGKVIAVCEPVDWTRVTAHGPQIGHELATGADRIFLLDVNAANSTAPTDDAGHAITAEILHSGKPLHQVLAVEVPDLVSYTAHPGDVVILLGSDGLAELRTDIAAWLATRLVPVS
ncbi:UDP-N-acetylmuramate--L-alanine ligase [Longispora urticae]